MPKGTETEQASLRGDLNTCETLLRGSVCGSSLHTVTLPVNYVHKSLQNNVYKAPRVRDIELLVF